MKIWTINTIVDGSAEAEIVFSEAEADAREEAHYSALWAEVMEGEEYPGDAASAHAILSGEDVSDDQLMWVTLHELAEHPAAKEARATLNLCIERLDLNDVDGEERPFIEDCQTAIKLLEA